MIPNSRPLFLDVPHAPHALCSITYMAFSAHEAAKLWRMNITAKSFPISDVADVAGVAAKIRAVPAYHLIVQFPPMPVTTPSKGKKSGWNHPRVKERKHRIGRPNGRPSSRDSWRFLPKSGPCQGSAPTPQLEKRRTPVTEANVDQSAEKRRRPKRIHVRLTAAEYDHALNQARIANLRPATMLRELALGADLRAVPRFPNDVYRAIKSLAGNLNQLAHQANMGRVDTGSVEALRQSVEALLKKLHG